MNPNVTEQPPAHPTELSGQSLGEIKTEADENYGQSLTQLTVLVSYSGSGGVEVITNHLVAGMLNAGVKIELLLLKTRGPHFSKLPEHPNLSIRKLKASSAWLAVPELKRYCNDHPGRVLMAIKDRAIQAASLANYLSGCKVSVVGQLHTNMQTGLAGRIKVLVRFRFKMMRYLYRFLTGVIAVSQDAADSLQSIVQLSPEKVTVLANPVITPDIEAKSQMEPVHPWLADKSQCVIVAAGRLSPQKNFALLIRAFKLVRQKKSAKLVILGEGPRRSQLEALCSELALTDDVSLFGFVDNPYAEMKHADLFVLSSDWEGSPTVLTECLSLGIPCVATAVGDVTETLQDGCIGPVVPCNNEQALAAAIIHTLDVPPANDKLKQAVHKFRQVESVAAYLKQLARWQ